MFYHCTEFSGDESPERKDHKCLSVETVAGIAIILSLLVILPVGVALGCCGMWYLMKKSVGQEKPQSIYDVPDLTQTALTKNILPLSDNQAYGCATRSRK